MTASSRRSLVALIGGAIAIGFAPIFVRLSAMPPVVSAFWRLTLATPILWMLVYREHLRGHSAGKAQFRFSPWLLLPGAFFAADLGVWHWSVTLTTPANSTLEANFSVFLVTLVGFLWLGERIGARFLIGMVLAIAGAAVLLGVSFGESPDRDLGDALGFLTAVFYAGYILSMKRLRADHSTIWLMANMTLFASICLIPAALLQSGPVVPPNTREWSLLLALALVSHCAGQGLIAYALARLPASFSSVTLLLQPVVVAVSSWIILDIALAPIEIAGGITILIGIYLARPRDDASTAAPAAAQSKAGV